MAGTVKAITLPIMDRSAAATDSHSEKRAHAAKGVSAETCGTRVASMPALLWTWTLQHESDVKRIQAQYQLICDRGAHSSAISAFDTPLVRQPSGSSAASRVNQNLCGFGEVASRIV